MQTNVSVMTLSSNKPIRIIDVPGHPRLRDQFQDHLSDAKAVGFVVDTNSVSRNAPAVAEWVFVDPWYRYSLLIMIFKDTFIVSCTLLLLFLLRSRNHLCLSLPTNRICSKLDHHKQIQPLLLLIEWRLFLSENLRNEELHKEEASTLKGWERKAKGLIWEAWNVVKRKVLHSSLMIGKAEMLCSWARRLYPTHHNRMRNPLARMVWPPCRSG